MFSFTVASLFGPNVRAGRCKHFDSCKGFISSPQQPPSRGAPVKAQQQDNTQLTGGREMQGASQQLISHGGAASSQTFQRQRPPEGHAAAT